MPNFKGRYINYGAFQSFIMTAKNVVVLVEPWSEGTR